MHLVICCCYFIVILWSPLAVEEATCCCLGLLLVLTCQCCCYCQQHLMSLSLSHWKHCLLSLSLLHLAFFLIATLLLFYFYSQCTSCCFLYYLLSSTFSVIVIIALVSKGPACYSLSGQCPGMEDLHNWSHQSYSLLTLISSCWDNKYMPHVQAITWTGQATLEEVPQQQRAMGTHTWLSQEHF